MKGKHALVCIFSHREVVECEAFQWELAAPGPCYHTSEWTAEGQVEVHLKLRLYMRARACQQKMAAVRVSGLS